MDAAEKIPAPYPSIGQSFLIVGIVILMSVACSPLLFLAAWIGNETALLIYYLTAFGLAFYIVNSIRQRRLGVSNYNFQIGSWRQIVPLVFGTVSLLFGVIAPIQSLIPMPEAAEAMFREAASATGWSTFAYFVLAAPLLEELIFRGIMLDGLLKRYRPLTSIIVSSLLFGLAHLNPWQFVTGFVIGCFLGWVYLRTGSVGACIVIHMAANFSGYVLRMYLQYAADTDQQGGVVDVTGEMTRGYLAFSALLCLVFASSVYWLRREFDDGHALGAESAVA
jgi:uncharacterized protein